MTLQMISGNPLRGCVVPLRWKETMLGNSVKLPNRVEGCFSITMPPEPNLRTDVQAYGNVARPQIDMACGSLHRLHLPENKASHICFNKGIIA